MTQRHTGPAAERPGGPAARPPGDEFDTGPAQISVPDSEPGVHLYGTGRDGSTVTVVRWGETGDLSHAPVAGSEQRTTRAGPWTGSTPDPSWWDHGHEAMTMRSGNEPVTARSPLRLRFWLSLWGLIWAAAGTAAFSMAGRSGWAAACGAVALLAAVDLAVVIHHIHQGAHYQPGPDIPPYEPPRH